MHPNTQQPRPPRAAPRALLAAILALVWAQWTAAECRLPPAQPGTDDAGKDLRDTNFSGARLTGADFAGARLDGTSFKGADLTGADFSGAHLGVSGRSRGASLTLANLTGACFQGALLDQTEFEFADLTCAAFTQTSIRNAVFGPRIRAADPAGPCRTSFAGTEMNCEFMSQWRDLDLTLARLGACKNLGYKDFSGAHMNGVDFRGLRTLYSRWRGAQLRGTDFSGAALSSAAGGTDLFGADLSQARLVNAQLDYANLNQVKLTGADASGASLIGARLGGAAMSGIKLAGADLSGAMLSGRPGPDTGDPFLPPADLSFAYMPDAVLTGARLARVDLSRADLVGARADNADMLGINLNAANLLGVNLASARLVGARLDSSVLISANLAGADAAAVFLANTCLQGADLTDAQLAGANLTSTAIALQDGVPLFQLAAGLAADLDRRRLSAALDAAFAANNYPLPSCPHPAITVVAAGAEWELAAPFATPGSNALRYTGYTLLAKTGTIVVYGTELTLVRVDPQGVPSRVQIPVQPTRIDPKSFDNDTIMPNGRTFGVDVRDGVGWEDMMTAQDKGIGWDAIQTEPDDIPSPERRCPPKGPTGAPGPAAAPADHQETP